LYREYALMTLKHVLLASCPCIRCLASPNHLKTLRDIPKAYGYLHISESLSCPILRQPAPFSWLLLLLVLYESSEVQNSLVSASTQLRLRSLVNRLHQRLNLGLSRLKVLQEVVLPKNLPIACQFFVTVDVKQLIESLDGVSSRGFGQCVDNSDEEDANLPVECNRGRVPCQLAQDTDALDAETLERVFGLLVLGLVSVRAVRVRLGKALRRLVEGHKLVVLVATQGHASRQASGDGPRKAGHLGGQLDISGVGGQNGNNDLAPDGPAGGCPCLQDGGVVVFGEVENRDGPSDVAEGRQSMGLELCSTLGLRRCGREANKLRDGLLYQLTQGW
ncbi:hypothetical protein CI238_05035, partial [Colletotrichum incanum]